MRVLIVDDDETFCQFLAEVLQNNGMQVVWTTDGIAGFAESVKDISDARSGATHQVREGLDQVFQHRDTLHLTAQPTGAGLE